MKEMVVLLTICATVLVMAVHDYLTDPPNECEITLNNVPPVIVYTTTAESIDDCISKIEKWGRAWP